MVHPCTFGEWLHKCRKDKGIRSAAALAKKAGLALSHVSTFERGEFRPRWETAQRLAKALELTPPEYEEFCRAWGSAGKPREVREGEGTPMPPGVVLWKHLPGLLYQIPHNFASEFHLYPDMILMETVRACGALLSWIALETRPPSPKIRSLIRDEVHAHVSAADRWRFGGERLNPVGVAARVLPHSWRARIMHTWEATARLARNIIRWQFVGAALITESHNTIDIHLRETTLEDRWAVNGIEPNEVTDLHDAMIVYRLWNLIGLSDSLGPPTANVYATRCNSAYSLRELMTLDPQDTKEHHFSPGAMPQRFDERLLRFQYWWDLLANARFAVRILDTPDFRILDDQDHKFKLVKAEFPYTQEQVLSKVAEVASVLGINLDKHFSESLPR